MVGWGGDSTSRSFATRSTVMLHNYEYVEKIRLQDRRAKEPECHVLDAQAWAWRKPDKSCNTLIPFGAAAGTSQMPDS